MGESTLDWAGGCSSGQLGIEDNGLDASLGGRLCFKAHETAQEVDQVSSGLLDHGR